MQDIHSALKRYWGYDSFRPMQERIIHSLMDGQDVAVVMPTGDDRALVVGSPRDGSGASEDEVDGQTEEIVSPRVALQPNAKHEVEIAAPSAPARELSRASVEGQLARTNELAQLQPQMQYAALQGGQAPFQQSPFQHQQSPFQYGAPQFQAAFGIPAFGGQQQRLTQQDVADVARQLVGLIPQVIGNLQAFNQQRMN